MSLASDKATLYSAGFILEDTSGHYRLKRVKLGNQQVSNGDLGPVGSLTNLQTAVTASLTLVTNIVADEAARVALGNLNFGAHGSYNHHGSGFTQYV